MYVCARVGAAKQYIPTQSLHHGGTASEKRRSTDAGHCLYCESGDLDTLGRDGGLQWIRNKGGREKKKNYRGIHTDSSSVSDRGRDELTAIHWEKRRAAYNLEETTSQQKNF